MEKEIKQEDFIYHSFHNESEFSLKIIHGPTGLYEELDDNKIQYSYFKARKLLMDKLLTRLTDEGYEDKSNVTGRSNP